MLGNRFHRWAVALREIGQILDACIKAMDRGCATVDIVRTLAHAAPLHSGRVGPAVAQPVVAAPPPSIAAYNGPITYPCSNAQNATCHPAQKLERLKEGVKLLSQTVKQAGTYPEDVAQALDLLLYLNRD